MNKSALYIFCVTLAAAAIAILTSLQAAAPVLAHANSNEVKPYVQLVVHSQGVGSSATSLDDPSATAVAQVNNYNYAFATGTGQRQSGTNEEVQEEQISAPLGLDSQLLLSSQAANGGAQASSEVASVIRNSVPGLSVIGTVVAQSSGAGATASANLMLGLVLNGPSTVRIENCAIFDQGVLSGRSGLSRERGSCTFQASGDAAQSMEPQGMPLPANGRAGQFVMFEINIEQGEVAGKGSQVNSGFAIEILPGTGECVLVVEGSGNSPVEHMVVPAIPREIPNVLVYNRTKRNLERIRGDIDIGLTPSADEEAQVLARAAAAQLARPVDADLRLEFNGPSDTGGLHKALITPRNGDPVTLGFEFNQAQGPQDQEAVKSLVVEALRELVERC